jgi:mycothiol synthase
MRRPWLDDLPDGPPLPAGYALRTAQPADLPLLARLLDRAFGPGSWDEARTERTLRDDPSVLATYVLARDGDLVATASVRVLEEYPGSGYLHWVGADPDEQGKGLGTLVSLRVLRHFKEMGLRDAVLETQTFRVPAVRTYLRLGFVPEYRYGDPGEQMRWAQLLPSLIR